MDQIYELDFWDAARIGWQIKFYLPEYSGAIETLKGGPTPLQFDFQNGDDDYADPFRPTQAKITIKSGQNWEFTDLFPADIMNCWVEIYQGLDSDAVLYWTGWIDPSQYEEPYDVPPFYLTITCVDGLSYLADIKYVEVENSDGTYAFYEDRALESNIIYNILSKIGYTEFNEFVNFYEAQMNAGAAYSPMNQLLLENDRFYDMSCEEVLIEVLKKFRAVIRQSDGVFEIFRPVELHNTSILGRHFTSATASSPISVSPRQYIHRTATHKESALRQIPGGITRQINPAKKININQEYGSRDSWINNYDLHVDTYDPATRKFENWVSYSPFGDPIIPISNLVPKEDNGVALDIFNRLQQEFGTYTKQTDTDEMFKIEFEYGFYNTVVTPKNQIYASFMLAQGFGDNTKYLTDSGQEEHELEWADVFLGYYAHTDKEDGVGYGWSGWKTATFTCKSIPMTAPITIYLTNRYSEDVYVAFRNVKFSAGTTELSKITYERTFWERIKTGRWASWGNRIPYWRRGTRYVLKSKYKEVDNVVEATYNPRTNVINGDVLDFDFMLGDIVKESTPAIKGDTGLTNNIEQFAGSLAILSPQAVSAAVQTWISQNYAAFEYVDVLISYDENSDGISRILFRAAVSGVDFSGAAAAIGSMTGDVDGEAYTIIANKAGARHLIELTITGSSGSGLLTINGVARTMNFYGTSIDETIQHFVDLYGAAWLPITIEMNSAYDALLIHGDDEGNTFTYSWSASGLSASETYKVTGSSMGRRTDAVEITGTSGIASISCCGVTRIFTFSLDLSTPSSEWGTSDESTDLFPFKPLLQIIGDEIATQYNRIRQFIQMPIIERITDVYSGLYINGSIIDTQNEYDGEPRVFVINRGSFDVRNRKWELDLVEIIPVIALQPEIEPSVIPSYESSEALESTEISSEDFGVLLNHIDTIADGRYGATMFASFEYTSGEAKTANIKYYFSSDAAGELAVTIETTVEIEFASGTHTKIIPGISYPTYTGKYLQVYLEDDIDEFISSNEFDSVLIVLNHIDTISSPQEPLSEITPDVTFSTTTTGGSLTVTIYWNIRNASDQIIASGSQSLAFSTGTADKTFTLVGTPSGEHEDCTLNIGFSAGSKTAISNTFTIAMI
jgi:hypothetical protein